MGRFNFDQKYVLMDVTPEMASRWLKLNLNNRTVNHNNVDAIAKDILSNDWDTTHQGIAIAADGTIIDGQHRLLAIVKANKSVKMWVLQNAVKSTHIDSGLKRSESNRLQMGKPGLEWVNGKVIAPVNLIKKLYPRLGIDQIAKEDEWIRQYEDIIRISAGLAKRSKLARLNNAGIMAGYIIALMNGVPEEPLKTFSQVLISGLPNSESEKYAIVLRNELIEYRGATSGDTWRKFVFIRTCQRINQFYLAETGKNEPKRIRSNIIPYDIFDAAGKICYHCDQFVGA